MRIGFAWGILAGGVVVAALGWMLSGMPGMQTPTGEPKGTPTQSAVVEQPSGRVVAEVATPLPAAPAPATETAREPSGAAAAGSGAGEAGRAEGEAASQGAATELAGSATPGPDELAAAPARSGASSGVSAIAPTEGSAVTTVDGNDAGGAVAEGVAEGTAEAPGSRSGQLAALTPAELSAAPAPPAGALGAPGQANAPATEATPTPPADPLAPGFDVVRVDASGQTVIAGRAQPGQDVEVLLDSKVVDTVRADGSGRFVSVITADLSGQARQLQLRVTVPVAEVADTGQTGPADTAETAGAAAPPAGEAAGQPAQAGPGAAVDGAGGGLRRRDGHGSRQQRWRQGRRRRCGETGATAYRRARDGRQSRAPGHGAGPHGPKWRWPRGKAVPRRTQRAVRHRRLPGPLPREQLTAARPRTRRWAERRAVTIRQPDGTGPAPTARSRAAQPQKARRRPARAAPDHRQAAHRRRDRRAARLPRAPRLAR